MIRARVRRLLQPKWELGAVVYDSHGHWTFARAH